MIGLTASTGLGEKLALRPGVYCTHGAGGDLQLVSSGGSERLGHVDRAFLPLLRELASDSATMDQLTANYRQAGGDQPAKLLDLMARLRAGGWLSTTVTVDDTPLYTMVPERCPPETPAGEAPALALSRFAVLHRESGDFVLESPRSWCQLRLADPRALALVGGLTPGRSAALPAIGLPAQACHRLRKDLWWAELAYPVSAISEEDQQLRLRQWAPHELWLHARSGRRGPGAASGGTWWARGKFPPPPAAHPPFGSVVALPRPDLSGLRAADPPMTAVLEDRRSIRQHDDAAPLRLSQLSEFLYRCARNRRQFTTDGFEYLSRPYPAGGAVYELEVYPVVRRMADLAAGMYYYRPDEHRLERVAAPDQTVGRLLRGAAWSMAQQSEPQVLLVVAARFSRVMFKYEQMSYSLILKHVGVLYQMMYMVATAMGLAPCGLGVADSAAFAEATGLDPLEESSVGEFALGSRPVEFGGGE